ncbi:hypothetical protein CBQ28_19860 [Pseudoalteromonas sp. GCY]|uniref:hypothetical protein n=1 Tax=Pseudoalteromonas sp. GCY TaxID=2003316 RepID=UPI000BFEED3B|nr:hypothetical protein [Pseudoalteromonas sp. GCY]PHI35399.1 hypothetical protein CBQ28_19860 [Pseudoalteromonas sp. GCY]QQQ68492.1 hypothetical protein JJQ94_12085 [Pseudoalteromonas sp. GCY]
MKRILLSVGLAVWLSGCAHHDDVRPSSDGVHNIMLFSDSRDAGSKEALKQARHYCKQADMVAYVVNLDIIYNSDTPESTYITQKGVANAVEAAGMAMWIFGRNSVDDAGAAMTIGGGIADGALGKPYDVRLNFKCE